MLVLDVQGSRHRFPAMPEPPSLTGTVPGTWRISFSVPARLAPELGGRTWLQFGAVLVALPVAVEPPGGANPEPLGAAPSAESSPPGPEPDRDALAARRLPSLELAADSALRRTTGGESATAELTDQIEALQEQLRTARRESARLSASLAQRQRERLAAEQQAHTEQALRLDMVQELAARERESEAAREALGELAAGEQRVRDLEHELEGLRRRADEAEQLAAAAAVARRRAERRAQALSRAAEPVAPAAEAAVLAVELAAPAAEAAVLAAEPAAPAAEAIVPAQIRSLVLERELIAQRAGMQRRWPSEPPRPAAAERRPSPEPPAAPAPETLPEPAGAPPDDGLRSTVEALRAELATRASGEGRLRAQIAIARGRLDARLASENELSATLAQLREELEGLRSALAGETAARIRIELRAIELERDLTAARERSGRAYEAIEDLRATLEQVRAAQATSPPVALATGPVEPQRLSDAFSRLRETVPPSPEPTLEGVQALRRLDAEPAAGAGKPWLAPVFKALVRTDASRAGRLLLDLLPAQAAAYPDPVAYDLALGEPPGFVQVTVREGTAEIKFSDAARERGEADFQVVGSPARIARLLTARALRRRLGRGVARVRGDRDALSALRALVDNRLYLSEWHAADVRVDAGTALSVVSLMIDPAWTAGERFTVAHEDGEATTYVQVRDGAALTVSTLPPAAPAASTITCTADSLLLLLAGGRPEPLALRGEARPLALLLDWVQRAQSG